MIKSVLAEIINRSVERARLKGNMAATCAYLCLEYYDHLKDLHPDEAYDLFNQRRSWKTEFRKHMALGKLLEQKGLTIQEVK